MKAHGPLAFALTLAVSAPLAAGSFDEAMAALRAGDAGSGAAQFHDLAAAGDGLAMFNLALLYHHGTGLPQNAGSAAYWAWRARLAGVPEGMALVARLSPLLSAAKRAALHDRLIRELTAEVEATPKDGPALAFLRLALVEEGLAAKPDRVQVYVWYSLAAALGHAPAAASRDAAFAALKPSEAEGAEARALEAFAVWCSAGTEGRPSACAVVVTPNG